MTWFSRLARRSSSARSATSGPRRRLLRLQGCDPLGQVEQFGALRGLLQDTERRAHLDRLRRVGCEVAAEGRNSLGGGLLQAPDGNLDHLPASEAVGGGEVGSLTPTTCAAVVMVGCSNNATMACSRLRVAFPLPVISGHERSCRLEGT